MMTLTIFYPFVFPSLRADLYEPSCIHGLCLFAAFALFVLLFCMFLSFIYHFHCFGARKQDPFYTPLLGLGVDLDDTKELDSGQAVGVCLLVDM